MGLLFLYYKTGGAKGATRGGYGVAIVAWREASFTHLAKSQALVLTAVASLAALVTPSEALRRVRCR